MAGRTEFSVSGWRNRVVEMPPRDAHDEQRPKMPTVMDFRGGWFTSQYHLHALDRGPDHESLGPCLATIMGLGPNRFVLPPRYRSFRIRRFSTRGNSVTHGPWHLRVLRLDELTQLGGEVTGKHWDLLNYSGGAARLGFEWTSGDGGELAFRTLTNSGQEQRLTEGQALRGTVTLPGEGLLQIRGHGRWRLTLRPESG